MLTDLATLKLGLDIANDDDDALLTSMIGQVSSMIFGYLSRPYLFKRQYTETFQGSCSSSKMLRNYPVLDIVSINAGYENIPASSDGLSPGYWFEPDEGIPPGRLQMVRLNGYQFPRQQCRIIYEAGYCIDSEPQNAAASVQVIAPWGQWALDGGVSYSTGSPLTLVTGTPGTGQYALGTRGQYIFASGDYGRPILISYSYIPAVIEQACIKVVGEQYNYMDRIGQKSVNVQGEIITYDLSDLPQYVKTALQPYRRLVPV